MPTSLSKITAKKEVINVLLEISSAKNAEGVAAPYNQVPAAQHVRCIQSVHHDELAKYRIRGVQLERQSQVKAGWT
jgi:hypothetical protein